MDEYITTRVDLHDYHLGSGYGSGNMVFLGDRGPVKVIQKRDEHREA